VDDGPYAPDGSLIALYAALPALGEHELVHSAVPAGSEILELGAGAGRITRGLVALGHQVVAVDQSQAMLDRIDTAETVVADLEECSLGRRFPVVLLASNFVNHQDRSRVRAYLDSCAARPPERAGAHPGVSARLATEHRVARPRWGSAPSSLVRAGRVRASRRDGVRRG